MGFTGVSVRGTTIELLDILGRFSFAEFHFLVFVLVVFQIEGGTPSKLSFHEWTSVVKFP